MIWRRKFSTKLLQKNFLNFMRWSSWIAISCVCLWIYRPPFRYANLLLVRKTDRLITVATHSTFAFEESHILRTSPFFQDEFLTMDGKRVLIESGFIVLCSEQRQIKIISEETFYNPQFKPYKVDAINSLTRKGKCSRWMLTVNQDIVRRVAVHSGRWNLSNGIRRNHSNRCAII